MGVFSLFTRPTVEYRNVTYTNSDGTRGRHYEFKIPAQLQYLINPASGLKVRGFQAALLQNTGIDFPDVQPTGWAYEGPAAQPDGSPRHVFRTDYVSSGCLNSNVFSLETRAHAIRRGALR